MVDIKPGEVYVPGSGAATARALLDAAVAAGLDPKRAVRTTNGGFVVPEEIAPTPGRRAGKTKTSAKAPRGRSKTTK